MSKPRQFQRSEEHQSHKNFYQEDEESNNKDNELPQIKNVSKNKLGADAGGRWLTHAKRNKYHEFDRMTPDWFISEVRRKGFETDPRVKHLSLEEKSQFLNDLVKRFWGREVTIKTTGTKYYHGGWYQKSELDYYTRPGYQFFGECWDQLIDEELIGRHLKSIPVYISNPSDEKPVPIKPRPHIISKLFEPSDEPKPRAGVKRAKEILERRRRERESSAN